MKIKVQVIDNDGKEFSGEIILHPSKQPQRKKINIESSDYSGLKGGIEFLMDKGFFLNLKSSKEVQDELKKENYFHSVQSVDKRLRYMVSKKLLTRIKEENIWKYALRK